MQGWEVCRPAASDHVPVTASLIARGLASCDENAQAPHDEEAHVRLSEVTP